MIGIVVAVPADEVEAVVVGAVLLVAGLFPVARATPAPVGAAFADVLVAPASPVGAALAFRGVGNHGGGDRGPGRR